MAASNKKINEKITKYLLEKGVKPNLKGFGFLKRAIELTIKNTCKPIPAKKQLHPTIAREFCETPSSVERVMRHAIKSSPIREVSTQTVSEFIMRASLDVCTQRFDI